MTSKRSRNVCYTWNNPTLSPEDWDALARTIPYTYHIFGEENAPTTGTPHYQGYIEFSTPTTWSRIKKRLGTDEIHLEDRKGTAQQAADYCKEDGVFHEFGEISHQGVRSDIDAFVTTMRREGIRSAAQQLPAQYVRYHRGFQSLHMLDLSAQPRAPPTVQFFYGPGRCGKTRLAYGDGADISKLCLAQGWFDGYLGESTVIFDDFDGAASKVALSAILQYLDRYPVLVPVKGAFVPLVATKIIVTSNYHWNQWYDWSTRANQFTSLALRFDEVLAWRSAKPGHDGPRTFRRGTVEFEAFMDGPITTGVVVKDLTKEDDVYYSFIDNIQ